MVSNVPRTRSVLPLSPTGLEAETDEIFKLTTKQGKISVDVIETGGDNKKEPFPADMIFE